MKKTRSRLLSLLLSFCIIISCVAGFSVTSGAELKDSTVKTSQYGANSYISFSAGDYGGFDYNGYHSFNVNGIVNEKKKYTTCDDHGYVTALKVGDNSKKILPNDGSEFVFGKVYSIDGMQVRITASIESGAKSVLITYEVCNPTKKPYPVQIGSCSDIRIGESDYQCTEFLSKGIVSKDISDTSVTEGAEIKIFPGNDPFDTRWSGSYDADAPDGGVLNNIFNNRDNNTPYKNDGALAWSWRAVIPAGETIKRTVQIGMSVGKTYKVTYDSNGVPGEVPVDTKDYDNGAKVTVRGQGSLVNGNNLFLGWNTKPDGSGSNYHEGDTFNIKSNVDLYAVWKSVNKSVLKDTLDEAEEFYDEIKNSSAYYKIANTLYDAIGEAAKVYEIKDLSQNKADAAQKELQSVLSRSKDYVDWDEYRRMSIEYTENTVEKYKGTKTGTMAKEILEKLPGIKYDFDKSYKENIDIINDLVSPISNSGASTSGGSSSGETSKDSSAAAPAVSSSDTNSTKTQTKTRMNAVLNQDRTVTVKWDSIAGAKKYILFVEIDGKTAGAYESQKNFVTITKSVKNNTTMSFSLKYVSDGTLYEATESYKYDLNIYYKPAPKLTYKNGRVIISWKKVPNAEKYKIYRLQDGKFKLKYITETKKSSVSLGNIKSGKTYSYAVTAVVNGEEIPATRGDLVKIKVK